MKRLSIIALVFLLGAWCTAATAQRTFKHPGGILGQSDLDRIKAHVEAGDEPWATCWKQLQAITYSQPTYEARPTAEIGGSDGTRQRAAGDAYAALMNAVEWHVTGDTRYADCAVRILTGWGNTLETVSAELFQYPCRAMIVAAEMLRTSDGAFYEGWAEKDRTQFLDKVRTLMVPACRKFCTYQGTHPSWYTPAALVVLGAGVLLDDEALYTEGYNLMMATDHWGTMYGGSIEPSGQMREMGRDNVHGGLTLGDITQACLFAWNQGDDMFAEGDNRLLRGMEYWCRYNTGHTDVPYEPLDCSGLDGMSGIKFYFVSLHSNGFRLQPDACSFEAVYHHYKEVKGMNAEKEFPYLTIAARLARPDAKNEMLGFGTLFYTIDAASSPMITEKPANPTDVTAEDGYSYIRLSWQHPEREDVRGFKIYRSANGTNFTLLKTWDYYANNEYKDESVEPGRTYYYKVVHTNLAGNSEASDVVSATAQAGNDELPLGWHFTAIGSSLGGALYAEAQDTTFAVSGAGTDIGGTSDSHGFVYRKMTGDATLTVRLTSTSDGYKKVGLMMRETLNANAKRVALTMGEKGCRIVRTATRASAGGNTTWIEATNYGYAPLWMRLSRQGNTFTTYISRDSLTWHQIGQSTVSMQQTYYVGMASCSGSASTAYRAVFDHVDMQGTTYVPSSVPTTPTGFTAAWTDTRTAALSWKSVTDTDCYYIYRSADNASFYAIDTVRATAYDDIVDENGTYYYKVTAVNAIGESKATSVKKVTTYDVEKLTGTVIGTSGSYGNNSATTIKAALDGKLNTYYDASEVSGAWVGYDMGEDVTAEVIHVKYAPRPGYASRMTGGKFQVSNKVDFSTVVTIATVTEAPAEGTLTMLPARSIKEYRYLRYIGPEGGNCNVAEVQFYGRKTGDDGNAVTPTVVAEGDDGTIRYYDLNGRPINLPEGGHPSQGIYIQRKGGTCCKRVITNNHK